MTPPPAVVEPKKEMPKATEPKKGHTPGREEEFATAGAIRHRSRGHVAEDTGAARRVGQPVLTEPEKF